MSRTAILSLAVVGFVLLAHSSAQADRDIGIQFKTPTLGRKVRINQVWKVGDELWVISSIAPQRGAGLTAIGTAKDSVRVSADKKVKVRHFVIGKNWNWWDGDKAEFIKSVEALKEQMKKDDKKTDAVLYPTAKKKPD